MTQPRSLPPSRLRGAVLAMALLAPVCMAGSAPAQEADDARSTEERVRQAELDYEADRSAHEAAVAALRAALSLAERATSALASLDDPDDAGARNRAYATAQARWLEVEGRERRVEETRKALGESRENLLAALEERVAALEERARATEDPEEQELLFALWQDRQNQIRELEREGEPTVRFATVVPEITFDPRDGPTELRAKAEFLEHRAVLVDSAIVEIDVRIEELSRRDRNRSALQNFMRGIERFDDGAVPIGRAGRAAADRAGEDATDREGSQEAAGEGADDEERPLTPEERIRRLEALRERLEGFRGQIRQRAERFRNAVGSVG